MTLLDYSNNLYSSRKVWIRSLFFTKFRENRKGCIETGTKSCPDQKVRFVVLYQVSANMLSWYFFKGKIRTRLDLLSIVQSRGGKVKTFSRWDHRLQINTKPLQDI